MINAAQKTSISSSSHGEQSIPSLIFPCGSATPRGVFFKSVLASVWLAASVIFAGVFVIEERDHDHDHDGPGETCLICYEIQIAQRLIEALVRLGVSLLVVGFVSYTKLFIKPQTFLYQVSPIELKVKLNC
jgi:hypothetical protein